MHGGAHNALDPGRDVSDQVRSTTCLASDAFVRVAGDGKTFELRGEPWIFAGWNQWEVLEAASNAPPPFRHLPLPGREHIVRQMNEAGERRAQGYEDVGAHDHGGPRAADETGRVRRGNLFGVGFRASRGS
jgi:hypothetical protein